VSAAPEAAILRKLMVAANAISVGANDAAALMGTPPTDVASFLAFGPVERTAARALLKAVEQMQDVIARLFRTVLLAEAIDIAPLTTRDIANLMEKFGAIDDARAWSELTKLRNRLAHEYPVSSTAQLERVTEALEAVPKLQAVLAKLNDYLADKGYLP
jgi:uncharacterized protein YutE (UPF0331/DUF86 family)